MSKVITAVYNEGPTPASEMPRPPNTRERQDGIAAFDPTLASPTHGRGYGGGTEPVYYVIGKHSKEAVIREWLRANSTTFERAPRQAISTAINAYGSDWRSVWNDLAPEMYE